MHFFAEQIKRLGLTPEMLFRCADSEGLNTVSVDTFRIFLQRIKLGLTVPQIERITMICDERCVGVITFKDYSQTLQAFGINQEKIINQTG